MANVPTTLPLLVSDRVLLPASSLSLTIKDGLGLNTLEKYVWSSSDWSRIYLGLVTSTSAKSNDEGSKHSRDIGTVVLVKRTLVSSHPKPHCILNVKGICRFRLKSLIHSKQRLVGDIEQLDGFARQDVSTAAAAEDDPEAFDEFLARSWVLLRSMFAAAGNSRRLALIKQMMSSLPASRLVDVVGGVVTASEGEKRQILEMVEVKARAALVLSLIRRQLESPEATGTVRRSDHSNTMDNDQSATTPQRSQGALSRLINSDMEEIEELEQRLQDANLPKTAMKAATKELKRLKRMPSVHPEHAVLRNYLELLVDLPWSRSSEDHLDISRARQQLDADHYGLEKTKKRVLEYLAVRKLKSSLRGPILCLVGPPGVGKTSVARSIATSIGRSFHRVSLGGVSDEADIRGHRRTYIGSMPGRIISGLRSVGVNNPVFLLDEVDKLTRGSVRGDPAAALLEVLDSEQNNSFTDHYLTVPFDLSQVLFIATANTTASIPSALKDRMEVIRITGYNTDEKLHIAERHLVPKQLKEHGIGDGRLVLPRPTLSVVVSSYTREAGVRSLERQIGAVCRAIALQLAEEKPMPHQAGSNAVVRSSPGSRSLPDEETPVGLDTPLVSSSLAAIQTPGDLAMPSPVVVTPEMLEQLLGPVEYQRELGERLVTPGVAMGLAWTAHGGVLLFVEAVSMPGQGKISVTGNLGDVMKESARIAMSWIRAHAELYQLNGDVTAGTNGSIARKDLMQDRDIHIHFPAGAVGKDGPSAGITILVVLISLLSGRCVRSDTAMTGEVSLRGRVLPVGGIKEKVLAAHTAGVRRVILPGLNQKDVKEISDDIKNSMQLFFVDAIEDALQLAFEGGFHVSSRL
ncbi:lon protease homolog 2, peroxisomal-like [Sycon ciliatum]|uniref:lon protease homolog 2, peroxisomal-like n=1 Tax=Sycon ciliatum TaxID=27933 RepID=UPI0031F68EF7